MDDKRVELEKVASIDDATLARPGYPRAMGYPADTLSYGYPQQESGRINFRGIYRTIMKRKWLILVLAFIVTAVATVEIYRTKSIYTSSASIEVRRDNTVTMKTPNIIIPAEDISAMNTYMYKIKSRPLLIKVAAGLKLDQNPHFFDVTSRKSLAEGIATVFNRMRTSNPKPQPIPTVELVVGGNESEMTAEERAKWASYAGVIESGLKVEQIPAARLISVSYTHTDPLTASTVANAVAKYFIDDEFQSKTEKFHKTSEWLDSRTRELKAKVEQAEKRLADYLGSHDMSFAQQSESGSNSSGGNLGTTTFLRIYEQVQRAEQDRIIKQSLYEEVKKGNLPSLPEAYTDTKSGELQAQLREYRQEYAKLSVTYGEKNPKITAIKEQIAQVEQQLKDSMASLESKLKADYEQASRIEKELKTILEQSKKEAVAQNRDGIEYNMLKQEVATQRALYNEFLMKNTQADLERVEQNNNLRLAEVAEVPMAPVGPDRLKTILTWMILGLAGGIALAFFLEYLDNTIKTVEDVTNYAQLPALGIIPAIGSKKARRLSYGKPAAKALNGTNGASAMPGQIAALDTRSSIAEAYRVLRTSVMLSSAGSPPKIMLVTSGQPGEGKTTTTINTAVSLAQLGASVLVIDCDLRKPATHKVFGVDHTRGISTYLSRDIPVEDLIHKLPVANLSLLPCGPIPPNPAELISSEKMKSLLKYLATKYDHILIDSPPLMHVTDPVILSTMVEGVILVVHAGRSTRDIVRRARQELTSVGAKIFGVVLNNVDFRGAGYDDYYYYRYYESYGSDASEARGD